MCYDETFHYECHYCANNTHLIGWKKLRNVKQKSTVLNGDQSSEFIRKSSEPYLKAFKPTERFPEDLQWLRNVFGRLEAIRTLPDNFWNSFASVLLKNNHMICFPANLERTSIYYFVVSKWIEDFHEIDLRFIIAQLFSWIIGNDW